MCKASFQMQLKMLLVIKHLTNQPSLIKAKKSKTDLNAIPIVQHTQKEIRLSLSSWSIKLFD